MLNVVIKLMKVQSMFINNLKSTLKPYCINESEFSVLEFLYSKNEQTVDEIRKRILLSSGSVTYVLNNLVKKELVERKTCNKDKRICYVFLTSKGESLIKEIFPVHIKNTEKLFKNFSENEINELDNLLRKFKK